MSERVVRGLGEMDDFASEVAANLKSGDVLLLVGDLGSGKTAFVQGLAKHFDLSDKITSPTFTVVAEYEVNHDWLRSLAHVDLYRLEDEEVAYDVAVKDIVSRSDEDGRLTVIEWADKLPDSIEFKSVKNISFSYGDKEDERIVSYA